MKTRMVIPAVALALVAASCGGGEGITREPGSAPPSAGAPIPGGGLSVDEALASTLDGPLMVAGYLVAAFDEVRLCSALAESYPPQCGGSSLLVAGLDLASLDGLQSADGVSWTDAPLSVLGDVEDGVLTVATTSI